MSAIKSTWGERVTTVFPRQRHDAHDAASVAEYPAPDITVERIADLLLFDLPAIIAAAQGWWLTLSRAPRRTGSSVASTSATVQARGLQLSASA